MYTTHLGAASSESNYIEIVLAVSFSRTRTSYFFQPKRKVHLDGIMHKWANPNLKKTMKIYVIDSNNLINIRVSHSGLDHLVTDFVTILC